MTQQILPVLDIEALQKAATEYAMKGAMKSIEEYYCGYSSPFKEAITNDLKTKSIGSGIELPDLIALINESLSKEIDIIANTAISQTFIPLVKRTLTRRDAEVDFSDILREFVKSVDAEDIDDCEVEIDENSSYGWLRIKITHKENSYSITLHQDYDSKKAAVKKYQVLSLPREADSSSYSFSSPKNTMKLTVEGASLELPFIRDILHDKFNSFVAGLILAKSKITMDADSFDEDMFPEKCHC